MKSGDWADKTREQKRAELRRLVAEADKRFSNTDPAVLEQWLLAEAPLIERLVRYYLRELDASEGIDSEDVKASVNRRIFEICAKGELRAEDRRQLHNFVVHVVRKTVRSMVLDEAKSERAMRIIGASAEHAVDPSNEPEVDRVVVRRIEVHAGGHRNREILRLLADGVAPKRVAKRLGLTWAGLRSRVAKIRMRLPEAES